MNINEKIEAKINDFVESGAFLEHDRWSRWQNYMFSKGTMDSDGVFHLPKEFTDRWFRQIDTKYKDLSEAEKESDRKEVRTYIPLLRHALLSIAQESRNEALKEAEEAVESWVEPDGSLDEVFGKEYMKGRNSALGDVTRLLASLRTKE